MAAVSHLCGVCVCVCVLEVDHCSCRSVTLVLCDGRLVVVVVRDRWPLWKAQCAACYLYTVLVVDQCLRCMVCNGLPVLAVDAGWSDERGRR